MGLDGLNASSQPDGNLFGLQSASDHLKNFQFTIAQTFDARHGGTFASGCRFEELTRELRADDNLALEEQPDSTEDSLGLLLFHDVTAGDRTQRSFAIQTVVMHCKNKKGDLGMLRMDVFGEIQAMTVRNREIDDCQIGTMCGDRLEAFFKGPHGGADH